MHRIRSASTSVRACAPCGPEQPRGQSRRPRCVRGRIASASVGLSLALHGAIAVRLAFTRAPAPQPVDIHHDIELTTFVPSPAPLRAPAAPATALRHATSVRSKSAESNSRPPEGARPAPPAAPAPGPVEHAPPIDLFAADALRHAMSAPPNDPGGHLRRASDRPAPADDEREIVGGRVHEMVADAAARANARRRGTSRRAGARSSASWSKSFTRRRRSSGRSTPPKRSCIKSCARGSMASRAPAPSRAASTPRRRRCWGRRPA